MSRPFAWLMLVCLGLALARARGAVAESVRRTRVVEAVEAVMPSVANIGTETAIRVADLFAADFDRFFALHGRRPYKYTSLGSGIIVDSAGLALTNYHVVQRASNVMVRLVNGEVYEAAPIAYDVENDLCLLQLGGDLAGKSLVAIEFALPDDLMLGETVVTVGNPFGLENSVSTGVLSARNRGWREGDTVFNDVLQTDAAINPGNSGGPLINLAGQLIGMNLATHRDAEGIGFAIPLRRLEAVLASWLVPARFSNGYCGFSVATAMRAGRPLAVVDSLWEGSPAARAGLNVGDVIVALNGERVTRAVDVGRRIWQLTPGERVRLEDARGRTLWVEVEEMAPEVLVRQRLGIRGEPLTPGLARALALPDAGVAGLVISEVYPESDFAKRPLRWGAMVRRGDIITQAAGVPVTSSADLAGALRRTRSGSRIPVQLGAVDTLPTQTRLSYIQIDVTLN